MWYFSIKFSSYPYTKSKVVTTFPAFQINIIFTIKDSTYVVGKQKTTFYAHWVIALGLKLLRIRNATILSWVEWNCTKTRMQTLYILPRRLNILCFRMSYLVPFNKFYSSKEEKVKVIKIHRGITASYFQRQWSNFGFILLFARTLCKQKFPTEFRHIELNFLSHVFHFPATVRNFRFVVTDKY